MVKIPIDPVLHERLRGSPGASVKIQKFPRGLGAPVNAAALKSSTSLTSAGVLTGTFGEFHHLGVERLLHERDAARILGVSVSTLQRMRCEEKGRPTFARLAPGGARSDTASPIFSDGSRIFGRS